MPAAPVGPEAHALESLYLLIPFSAALVLGVIGVFGWAVHSGQFDGLEDEGARFLHDDLPGDLPVTAAALDADQGLGDAAAEESARRLNDPRSP